MSKYHKFLTESRRFIRKDTKRKQEHKKAEYKKIFRLLEAKHDN